MVSKNEIIVSTRAKTRTIKQLFEYASFSEFSFQHVPILIKWCAQKEARFEWYTRRGSEKRVKVKAKMNGNFGKTR